MTDELFERRRIKLEKELVELVLELFNQSGADAFMIPVVGTYPMVVFAAGSIEQIRQMIAVDIVA
jgi:hypothetical protein